MSERDHEREAAEADCERLRRLYLIGEASQSVRALSDTALAGELAVFRQLERAHLGYVYGMSPLQRATLGRLAPRLDMAGAREEDVHEALADRFGLVVAEDGLIEGNPLTEAAQRLIGDEPVALYHHTSSGLLGEIRTKGLLIGRPTNFFNTQQGVYVSTIANGEPVDVYQRRAARVHGGEPLALRVRRRLSELKPDPDDADLAWAQGRQFVTPAVPVEDLCELPQAFRPKLVPASDAGEACLEYDDGAVYGLVRPREGGIEVIVWRCAAPGCGRTRQALHWLAEQHGPVSVVAVDDGDPDAVAYWTHMLGTGLVRAVFDHEGREIELGAERSATGQRPRAG
jgi:hypothetical protein